MQRQATTRHLQLCAALCAVCALLFATVSATNAQAPDGDCTLFAETGHLVCDDFKEFFFTRGGTEVFGFPRTTYYQDPKSGRWVQYFQRARMEWHPENPPPYRVQLGLLADELGYNRFPPAAPEDIPAQNSQQHHYFPETQHVVSFGFLTFYRAKGGLDVFGYPRSEFMFEDDQIVQYFQRARMEWHPEASPGPEITLTNLGDIYIERYGVPESVLKPSGNPLTFQPAEGGQRLTAIASVRHVIIGQNEQQTVFIYITNVQQQPVEGALASVTVNYPGNAQLFPSPPTNEHGFTKVSFIVSPNASPGERVPIDVIVQTGNAVGRTSNFFMPWW
ncbi:MAG: hypothetical protein GX620_06495 [Chloroflexi bacterium]|nr:hypothetical protein [Chloroflexota bacterium]